MVRGDVVPVRPNPYFCRELHRERSFSRPTHPGLAPVCNRCGRSSVAELVESYDTSPRVASGGASARA